MIQQTNYKKLLRLIPDLYEIKVAAKYKANGFMDLGVDIIYRSDRHIHIALSHYYRHPSGDMIADPDMQIAVYPTLRMAYVISYQDSFGYKEVYPDYAMATGTWTKVYNRPQRDLDRFFGTWLTNLMRQGFTRAT